MFTGLYSALQKATTIESSISIMTT